MVFDCDTGRDYERSGRDGRPAEGAFCCHMDRKRGEGYRRRGFRDLLSFQIVLHEFDVRFFF